MDVGATCVACGGRSRTAITRDEGDIHYKHVGRHTSRGYKCGGTPEDDVSYT